MSQEVPSPVFNAEQIDSMAAAERVTQIFDIIIDHVIDQTAGDDEDERQAVRDQLEDLGVQRGAQMEGIDYEVTLEPAFDDSEEDSLADEVDLPSPFCDIGLLYRGLVEVYNPAEEVYYQNQIWELGDSAGLFAGTHIIINEGLEAASKIAKVDTDAHFLADYVDHLYFLSEKAKRNGDSLDSYILSKVAEETARHGVITSPYFRRIGNIAILNKQDAGELMVLMMRAFNDDPTELE